MYQAAQNRYNTLPTRRCGNSGLLLPAVSLGLWHNFGDTAPIILAIPPRMRTCVRSAVRRLITALPTLTLPITMAQNRVLPSAILAGSYTMTLAFTAMS